MLLFVSFFEREWETSWGAKKKTPSLETIVCIVYSQKSQDSSPQLGSVQKSQCCLTCFVQLLVQTDEVQIICASEVCTSALPQLLCTDYNIWCVGVIFFHVSVISVNHESGANSPNLHHSKSCYFREGMAGFIFVQEEASPEPQDLIAGAMLMGSQ